MGFRRRQTGYRMAKNDLIDEALNRSLSASEFRPADMHLDRKDGLTIKWDDGHTSHFSLGELRKQCPCATCRSEREAPKSKGNPLSLDVLPANIGRATQFANARLVGNYAIQVEWGDGHNTGIYDFRYLRLLCPPEKHTAGGP